MYCNCKSCKIIYSSFTSSSISSRYPANTESACSIGFDVLKVSPTVIVFFETFSSREVAGTVRMLIVCTVLLPRTFYVSDYAGNERAIIYHLADDVAAPKILPDYDVSYDRKTKV